MKEDAKKAYELNEEELDEVVGGEKWYTIQDGDTLSKIAAHYSTTVKQLCKWNNISNPTFIVAGKKIRVA